LEVLEYRNGAQAYPLTGWALDSFGMLEQHTFIKDDQLVACYIQAEFDDAVKTNLEDFDMEVGMCCKD